MTVVKAVAQSPRRGILSFFDQSTFDLRSLPPIPAGQTAFAALLDRSCQDVPAIRCPEQGGQPSRWRERGGARKWVPKPVRTGSADRPASAPGFKAGGLLSGIRSSARRKSPGRDGAPIHWHDAVVAGHESRCPGQDGRDIDHRDQSGSGRATARRRGGRTSPVPQETRRTDRVRSGVPAWLGSGWTYSGRSRRRSPWNKINS